MSKRGYHFTPEEKTRIRAAFDDGLFPEEIAGDLECSTRIINTYYARFRGGPAKKGPRKMQPRPPSPRMQPTFYTSSFEL